MNIVALVGNIATDPEVRTTAGGRTVCQFRIAVSRPSSSSEADFFTVVAWEKQAEVCRDYLTVGRRIGVEGRLHHSSWRTDDDQPRSSVEVVAHRVELLGPGRSRPGGEGGEPTDGAASSGALPSVSLDGDSDNSAATNGSSTHADARDTAREPELV